MAIKDPTAKFREFTGLKYADQAKAFLNAYWQEWQTNCEQVWTWWNQFLELDLDNGKEGKDLDEFNAHRFLERMGETLTIKDLRDRFKDIDMDFNRRMAFVEYLLFRNGKSISDFLRRPQGDNSREIAEAQRQLDEATNALEIAKNAQEIATVEAEKAQQKAAASAQAELELKSALAELHAQEDAYNSKTQNLTAKSEDNSLGVVQRNKAKNELAQHLSEDPLPLRRAKLTTEAATKKAEKARVESEEAAIKAEETRRIADLRLLEAEKKFDDAEKFMEEVRSRPGGGQGALWWIERELAEARKWLPPRKNLR